MNFANLFRLDDDKVEVAAGENLLVSGQANEWMYVLLEGEMDIIVHGQRVEALQVGGIVGEMSLIEHKPSSADVIARTDSTLARIDRKRFEFLIQNHPYFAIGVMEAMAKRLRNSDRRLEGTGAE